MPLAPANEWVLEQLRAGFAPPFRGEIWDFIAKAPMGKGHGNDAKPFDITSANYLRPAFRAIKDPSVRKVVVKSGVKTLKTFVVESGIAYFCEHGKGDIGFYLSDIESAKDHAKSRFWDWLIVQGHKDIENRVWKHSFRGDVLIHASKGMSPAEYNEARAFVLRIRPEIMLPKAEDLQRGGIVGLARVTDCVSRSPSPWFAGPFGFVLDLAKSYPLPFQPCNGALGFYTFGEEINIQPQMDAD